MDSIAAVELKDITKHFAKVFAADHVSMCVHQGEVVALLGENGAGKSTVMKILYGLYQSDSGQIFIDGKERKIKTPKDAMDAGISMIQQHFSLVPAHTVAENIILGNCRGRIDYKATEKEIQDLADQYDFRISAGEKVKNLTVGEQQKVEILKALYLNARILIMDEPTAVLTPQESDTLMKFIRNYVKKGNSVVFITHKMKEVMEVADNIVVMRSGKVIGNVAKEETDEFKLARMMIRHELENVKRSGEDKTEELPVKLSVKNITVRKKGQTPLLEDISFDIHAGEILGFAGVSGNGQQELCEAIYGGLKTDEGAIRLDDADITELPITERIRRGIGYVASDRYRYGMVMGMSLAENMLLKSSYMKKWVKGGIIRRKSLNDYTDEMIRKYSVKAQDHSDLAGSLSGGNQQKAVVAREVDMGGSLLIFDQPTRGLDLGAINYVHKTIMDQKEKGKAILLVSTELSEIFALSDRIAVLYKGKIMGIYWNDELTTEKIGLLMAGYDVEEGANAV